MRPPFIIGPMADKIIGFIAGMFGQILGIIATIVVMFLWAGNGSPDAEIETRREHAKQVSLWSAAGCIIPSLLALVLFAGFFGAFGLGFLASFPR